MIFLRAQWQYNFSNRFGLNTDVDQRLVAVSIHKRVGIVDDFTFELRGRRGFRNSLDLSSLRSMSLNRLVARQLRSQQLFEHIEAGSGSTIDFTAASSTVGSCCSPESGARLRKQRGLLGLKVR